MTNKCPVPIVNDIEIVDEISRLIAADRAEELGKEALSKALRQVKDILLICDNELVMIWKFDDINRYWVCNVSVEYIANYKRAVFIPAYINGRKYGQ